MEEKERKEKQNKYYKKHKKEKGEIQKRYYQKHRNERIEYGNKYYEKHKDEKLEYQKKYCESNKEKVSKYQKEYHKKYYENNKHNINKHKKSESFVKDCDEYEFEDELFCPYCGTIVNLKWVPEDDNEYFLECKKCKKEFNVLECVDFEYDVAKTKAEYENPKYEYYGDGQIKCPHCDILTHNYSNTPYIMSMDDNDEFNFKCFHCEKEFFIKGFRLESYIIWREKEEEKDE